MFTHVILVSCQIPICTNGGKRFFTHRRCQLGRLKNPAESQNAWPTLKFFMNPRISSTHSLHDFTLPFFCGTDMYIERLLSFQLQYGLRIIIQLFWPQANYEAIKLKQRLCIRTVKLSGLPYRMKCPKGFWVYGRLINWVVREWPLWRLINAII